MPEFVVRVTDATTGAPHKIRVNAPSAEAAATLAASKGWRVEAGGGGPAVGAGDVELLGQVLIELRQIRETLASKRRGPIDKRVARAVAVGVFMGILTWTVFLFVLGLVLGALGLGVL